MKNFYNFIIIRKKIYILNIELVYSVLNIVYLNIAILIISILLGKIWKTLFYSSVIKKCLIFALSKFIKI